MSLYPNVILMKWPGHLTALEIMGTRVLFPRFAEITGLNDEFWIENNQRHALMQLDFFAQPYRMSIIKGHLEHYHQISVVRTRFLLNHCGGLFQNTRTRYANWLMSSLFRVCLYFFWCLHDYPLSTFQCNFMLYPSFHVG